MKKRNIKWKKSVITGINFAFLIFAIHGFFTVNDILRALSILDYPLQNIYYGMFAQYWGLVCSIWVFGLLLRDFFKPRA